MKTHFVFNIYIYILGGNRIVYETMWKNIVQADRPQKTIYYDACAFHTGYLRLQTHTPEYVIIIALPQQQWLHERASVSR